MSEVFREKIVPVQEEEHDPAPIQKGEPESPDTYSPNEPQDNLEIWEGENRRKYVTDYFNVRELAHEFNVKMPISQIDKYIKEQLSEQGYEKSIDNYKKLLQEIEAEIGSQPLELFKRLSKITGYIRVIRKISDLNKKKQLYLKSFVGSKSL